MTEEPWKKFLNWGTIIMFFATPTIVTILQVYALSHPGWLSQELPQSEFKYLYEFQRALAVLVFGLAGLRTFEVIQKNGQTKKEKHEP